MALPYAKTIVDRLNAELKPRGFRKVGQTFIRSVADSYQIVELLTSALGTVASQSYTVAFGVYNTRLEPLKSDATRLKGDDGHWTAFIGEFDAEWRDLWWRIRSDDEASIAAQEMVERLPSILAAMDGISSYEAILRIPRGAGATSDDPPGECDWRVINAAREREGLPPSKGLKRDEGWRDSWHRRHFPGPDGV